MTGLETVSSVYAGIGLIFGIIGVAECLTQPRAVYRRSWFQWWLDAGVCLTFVFPLIILGWPFYLFSRR